jgi:drug/metabolite transporter (DMT)-like permease
VNRVRDWTLLLVCNLIWGSQFVLVKVIQDQVGPLFAVLLPMAIATLLLMLFAPRPFGMAARDVGHFALLGVAGQVAAQVGATWGTQLSLAANAALLNLALPVVTGFLAYLMLRERMTPLRWAGLVLALGGALLGSGIDWGSLSLANRGYAAGNTLVLLGVTGSAFYNTYSKKLLARHDPVDLLLYSYYFVLLVMTPITMLSEPESFRAVAAFRPDVWLALGVLAVLQYGLSMVLFLRVLTRLDATQAALSNYLIPFFGLGLAAAILGERLTPLMIVSGVVVLASTFLATVADVREQSRS